MQNGEGHGPNLSKSSARRKIGGTLGKTQEIVRRKQENVVEIWDKLKLSDRNLKFQHVSTFEYLSALAVSRSHRSFESLEHTCQYSA